MRSLAVFIALSAGLLAFGCSPASSPCYGTTCGAGYECLANRCTVAGGTPVPRDSERVVLAPVELASIAEGRVSSAPTATLGSDRDSSALVYARFGSSYKGRSEIAAAFLLLTIAKGTEPLPDDVPLEVWTLAASWSNDSVARGARPGLSRPMARGIARTTPPSTVRVDVTTIVRELARASTDSGIGIAAGGSHGQGVTLVTRAEGAPRLEVYLAR